MPRTSLSLVAILPAAFAAACGGNGAAPGPQPPTLAASATSSVDAASPAPADVDAAAPATPPPQLPAPALVLGSASPDPAAPLPTVRITTPKADELVPTDKALDYAVSLDVENWQTASGSQHVHLLLDGLPYRALYDVKEPVKIRELLPGGAPLSDGQHVLVAFLGRANNESVKTPGAIAATTFWIGAQRSPAEGAPRVDVTKPTLVYSRPKGEYKGDQTGHILIDFQLLGATLAPGGDAVTLAVKGPGIAAELDARAERFGPPFYLDNAENGEYTLTLALVGRDGATLPGPWNSTVRTFKVDRSAVPESASGAPATADAADAGAP